MLLLDYLVRVKQAANSFIAKTIVTSDLGAKIAEAYGIEVKNTLTGFKFIGEQIQLSEETKDKTFLLAMKKVLGTW